MAKLLHLITVRGPRFSSRIWAFNISCFLAEGNDKKDNQAKQEHLQDKPKDQGEELVEINLPTPGEEARLFFVSANLSNKMKQALLGILREFKDVFA